MMRALAFLVLLAMTLPGVVGAAAPSGAVSAITVTAFGRGSELEITTTVPATARITRVDATAILVTIEAGAPVGQMAVPVHQAGIRNVTLVATGSGGGRLTITLTEPMIATLRSGFAPTQRIVIALTPVQPAIAQALPRDPAPAARPVPVPTAPPEGASAPAAAPSVPSSSDRPAAAPLPPSGGSIAMVEGQGYLLATPQIERVAVSAPDVVDVVTISEAEMLLNAKRSGRATVLVWLRGRDAISFTVEVGTGVPSERDRIVEILEKVGGATDPIRAVWVGTALVLTGTVRNQVVRDNLQAIASSAIRGMRDVSVVNQIEVRDPIQYKVAVRVTEIDNNALKELGVQWGMYWKGIVLDPTTGAYVVAPDGTFPDLRLGMLLFGLSGGGIMPLSGAQIAAQLLPFVQRGQATMLASPSVVTLAGKQAQIVVGGQIPVPGGNGTVEYRPYGAVLKFTPEHTGEGRLSLTLEASSSQLDWSNMVEVSGSRMPALIDRRVITQVSLQVGETFALGGMVAHVRQEWVQQIPILGSIPILGVLFRIKRFQERRSEVLFFVTPEEVSR